MLGSETKRLAYLSALGIVQYSPVDSIPGVPQLPVVEPQPEMDEEPSVYKEPSAYAKEPSAYANIEPVADSAENITQPEQASETAVDAASSSPSASDTTDSKVNPHLDGTGQQATLDVERLKAALTPKKAGSPAAHQSLPAVQRFSLLVVDLPNCCLIIEWAEPEAPGLSAKEVRYYNDWVLALAGAERDHPPAKVFRWPLVNNPRIAADAIAAKEGLLGFFAGAESTKRMIFLGGQAPALLSDVRVGQPFDVAGIPAIWTHSLEQMAQNWVLKGEAWQQVCDFLEA